MVHNGARWYLRGTAAGVVQTQTDNRLGGAVATANLAGYLLFCVVGGILAST